MKITLDITRRESPDAEPYILSAAFETVTGSETAAYALTSLNADPERRDVNGKPFPPIRWESSCLQKKCGACAMVICGKPMLACDARLEAVARGGRVTLEPLKKFPVIADLAVDREPMFAALAEMKQWLEEHGEVRPKETDRAFDASKCLQCGCCLEVCPNFCTGSAFYGTAAAVPASRLMAVTNDAERAALYRKHVYNGCGKSLACRNICPAGIDIDSLLVNSNAAAVWKRH